MSNKWFYIKDDVNNGPISDDDLKSLLEAGLLDDTALIWREGLPEWIVASSLDVKSPVAESERTIQNANGSKFLEKYNNHPAKYQLGLLIAVIIISGLIGIWLLSSNNEGDSNYDSFSGEVASEAPAEEAPESSYEEYGTDNNASTEYASDSRANEPDTNIRVLCSEYGNTDFKPGPEFIHVDIEMVNNGNNPIKISERDITLVAASGREYEQANTYSGNSYLRLIYETLNPGVRKKFTVDFDIPKTDSYKLVYLNQEIKLAVKDSCFESFSNEEFGWLKSNRSNTVKETVKPQEETIAKPKPTIATKKQDLFPVTAPIESDLRPYAGSVPPDWTRFMQVLGTRASQWKPPASASSGWVVLSLTINSQGQLIDATVKDSSGNFALEQAAINAAKAGQPYPFFPDGYTQDTVKVDYRFDYAGTPTKRQNTNSQKRYQY